MEDEQKKKEEEEEKALDKGEQEGVSADSSVRFLFFTWLNKIILLPLIYRIKQMTFFLLSSPLG